MESFATNYLSILASSALLTALFLCLEGARPAECGQPFAKWLVNVAYLPFILAWVLALQLLITPAAAALLRATGGGLLPRFIGAPRTLVGEVLFFLGFALAWDVWQYWVHRWQHSSPLLWRTHALHHAESALNATSQARHHPANYVLFAVLYTPMLLVFGDLAPHPVGAFVMFRLWGFVNHANVRVGFGRAARLVAGPQWHRIHHSARKEHANRNFAAYFPLIDAMFGTYYEPKADEYPPTGATVG